MNKSKKILSVFLSLLMIVLSMSAIGTVAFAEGEDAEIEIPEGFVEVAFSADDAAPGGYYIDVEGIIHYSMLHHGDTPMTEEEYQAYKDGPYYANTVASFVEGMGTIYYNPTTGEAYSQGEIFAPGQEEYELYIAYLMQVPPVEEPTTEPTTEPTEEPTTEPTAEPTEEPEDALTAFLLKLLNFLTELFNIFSEWTSNVEA